MSDMILDAFKLDGKVALVTGAARGIGQAIAIGLAEAGADVALLDRLDVDETARSVTGMSRRILAMREDISNLSPEFAARIVMDCIQHFGRIDILVNNAGIILRSPALEY